MLCACLIVVVLMGCMSHASVDIDSVYHPSVPIIAQLLIQKHGAGQSNPFTAPSLATILLVTSGISQPPRFYRRVCTEGQTSCQRIIDLPVLQLSASALLPKCSAASPSSEASVVEENLRTHNISHVDLVIVSFITTSGASLSLEQRNQCERSLVKLGLNHLLSDFGQLIFVYGTEEIPASTERLWWLDLVDVINRGYFSASFSSLPGDGLLQNLFISKGLLGFRKNAFLRDMPRRWTRAIGAVVRLSRKGMKRCGPRKTTPLTLPKVDIDLNLAPVPTYQALASSFSPEAYLHPWSVYANLSETFASHANALGSDKAATHNYNKQYGILFAPFYDPAQPKPIKMIEFGVKDFASMRLWERLFPQASSIVGVDITYNDSQRGNLRVYGGDQGSPAFLTKLVLNEKDQAFDIVIDDGGHTFWQQQLTFSVLFPRSLKKGGLFVIEDIETSYYRGYVMYGVLICGGRLMKSTTIEWAKEMILPVLKGEDPQIESMYFGTNMIAFRKKL